MSAPIHLLAKSLLGADNLQQADAAGIRALVEEHPYCAPARFLLVQKLKESGHADYDRELGRAVLYYHHPVQLAGLLHEGSFLKAAPPETVAPEALPAPEAQTPEVTPVMEASEPLPEPEIAAAAPAASAVPEAPAEEAPLAFEPFHTVDYFASQGIKLSHQEVGKDRFGRQLMSFTEWLKTMKRLPQAHAAGGIDQQSEQQVEALATQSVTSGDVLTEAMAEVWLKQGNRERAREVYRKLSLLHPAKSAYFAAKLDQIQS